jgi:hypothetical protein
VDQKKFDSLLANGQLPYGPLLMETYTASGIPLLCEMPDIVIGASGLAEPSVPKSVGSVASFLGSLRTQCMRHIDGWWTYEFCFGKHVRQYHATQAGKVEAEYFLGRLIDPQLGDVAAHSLDMDAAALLRELESIGVENADIPYYSETYQFGTACDIGEKAARRVELRWSCAVGASASSIRSIKEPSSCQYILEIDSPLLCQHPSYRSTEIPLHLVSCYFVDNDIQTLPTTHPAPVSSHNPLHASFAHTTSDQKTASSNERRQVKEESKQAESEAQNAPIDVSLKKKNALGLKMMITEDEPEVHTASTAILIESVKQRAQGVVDLAATREGASIDSNDDSDFEILEDEAVEALLQTLSDSELLVLLSTIDEAIALTKAHGDLDEDEKFLQPGERMVIALDRLPKQAEEEKEADSDSDQPPKSQK